LLEIRDTSVPITILQGAPVEFHHGGLGIARTAGRLGIPVYWMHPPVWVPAASSRYVYEETLWDADAPAEASVECLLERGRQIGGESILIPTDDKAAVFVEDQAEYLRERFLFPDQPYGLARSLGSKKEMHLLCKRMGVPTPEALFPQSNEEVAAFADTASFPIVLKRIAGWLPEPQMQMDSVVIVDSPEELLKEYQKHEKSEMQGEPNIMLQEYIPGGPESVWMFNGYFTNTSECLLGFTGKKIRQSPPFTGATTLGICLENEAVTRTTVDFLGRIGYSGIVDMGYRYDRRDGQYKLLDVNPRLGATFRLFVDSNAMDVVRALYLDLTNQPIQPGMPRQGRKWIVEQSDLWTSLQYGQLGRLTPEEWARSLRGIEEAAWFAWDDFVPFTAMCWASFVKVGRILKDKIKAVRKIRKFVAAAYRRHVGRVVSMGQ
jgi:D-aspartate ligase